MKLKSVEIENYRAIKKLKLPLDPSLTVLHGENGYGKTSVLSAIVVGLGAILEFFSRRLDIDFCLEDLREGAEDPRVSITAMDGTSWERQGVRKDEDQEEEEGLSQLNNQEEEGLSQLNNQEEEGLSQLNNLLEELDNSIMEGQPADLPIVAFYGTDRTTLDMPISPRNSRRRNPRYGALKEALAARSDFEDFFSWFHLKENEELREQRERLDFGYQIREVSVVRQAISSMLPEVSDPRTELKVSDPRTKLHRLRFVVSRESEQGQVEKLSLDQLSGGYRIVLALAADLARRMVQGNPHLDDPLKSEAVVLIDEVELHLHPAWQQRILGDLRRTFPNAQFIVSTHSPQVLTTVKPQRIVELAREGDRIVAGAPAGATYGAEAGDVLSLVMGVNERPDNDFTKALDQYRRLVSEGKGESEEALALRRKLEELSPRDYALNRADLEIRQRKLFKQMAESQ